MKKVKEVCMIAGISKRSLQYYDDEGILSAERSTGNERLYSDEVLKKLVRLLTYKKLGLKLEQIKQIIDLPKESQNSMLKEHVRMLSEKKEMLDNQTRFTEYIISNGVPELKTVVEEENKLTYVEQLDLLEKEVFRR